MKKYTLLSGLIASSLCTAYAENNIQAFNKISISQSYFVNKRTNHGLAFSQLPIDQKAARLMQLNNVKASENSTINIHEEDSIIDFDCIDCIVRESNGSEKELYSAWNGRSLIE